MDATLIATGLAADSAGQTLFSGVDLVLGPGEVLGLVGSNGAGKTTLLRILAGQAAAEDGTVRLAPQTATVGYLPQEPDRRAGETVGAFLARRTGVTRAALELEQALAALTNGGPGVDDTYSQALERWLNLGGADLEERAAQSLDELGRGITLDQPMTGLSGGQGARIGLASLLLSRYDVLLLDEPTNDLDLEGLKLLEQFVSGVRVATIVVSHDREFLARTVHQVLELDLVQQQTHLYGGGYAGYLKERELARQHARTEYEDYAETRTTLESRARTIRSWSDQGVRKAKRKATDKDKFVPNFRAETSENQAAKARQIERQLDRLEVVEEPRKQWQLRMEIAVAPRSGAVVAAARQAVVSRGGFRLGPVNLQIDWADRVAITGANGSGKSTLLAALLGRLPLDTGQAWLGPGVVLGEIDQARGLFQCDQPLLDAFGQATGGLLPAEVRTVLAKFGLRAEHVLRPSVTLSPGERTRAALALLQARGVNLLVLDEPTNHLDLPAIEQLESALSSYQGTLLLVTHDRRMLAAVRTTRRIEVVAGQVNEIEAA